MCALLRCRKYEKTLSYKKLPLKNYICKDLNPTHAKDLLLMYSLNIVRTSLVLSECNLNATRIHFDYADSFFNELPGGQAEYRENGIKPHRISKCN